MSTVIKSVLALIAMEAEAQPIIDRLKLQKLTPSKFPGPAPCVAFVGKLGSIDVTVVHNGKCKETKVDNVGTVPAALSAYLSLEHFKPDLLISAGTAGGFKSQGAKIGDVFLSSSCVHHDRRIPLKEYEAYGVGRKLSLSTEKLRTHLNVKSGVVTTGNSFDYTPTCMEIMQKHEASVKDMEAAAVAWTADLFGTPMFCLKSVTDIVDGDAVAADQFFANLQLASEALQSQLEAALHFMDGKQISDL